ncbi:hypothetical protein GCM10008955_18670 [Deinococcus malanensis]|uniref:Uncharacterized protein n=1 Tax=Deinococcus malanensis TaxID=1706855 RepID=A0ABQ2ETS4_9DEIO|nr:hypothetical protein GCM10008955_18670 [Deinococcus malanensis]
MLLVLEMSEDEASDKEIREVELHEAFETLVHRVIRAREINDLDELVQADYQSKFGMSVCNARQDDGDGWSNKS